MLKDNVCNYVYEAEFIKSKYVQKLVCGKPAVLQVNQDFACEEHAPELAELSDIDILKIEWPIKKK